MSFPAVINNELLPAIYTDGVFSPAILSFVSLIKASIELFIVLALPAILHTCPSRFTHSSKSCWLSGLTAITVIPSSSRDGITFFNFAGIITTSGWAATQASILNSLAVPILGSETACGAASLYICLVFALASIPTSLSLSPSPIRRLVEI